jgi:tetratricopeptide (TPR) repeat protein
MPYKWSQFDEKGLATFVHPELPKSFSLPDRVDRTELLQWKEYGKLAEEIYNALIAKNIKYALEPENNESNVQLIRTPEEILEIRKEGTCLDLAVLYCGLCLSFGLLPLLIVLRKHALVAVSLHYSRQEYWEAVTSEREQERSLFQKEPLKDVEFLRNLLRNGRFMAIECTGFAHTETALSESQPEGVERQKDGTLTFERAIAAGEEQLYLRDRPLEFALDIAIAHQHWKIKQDVVYLNPRLPVTPTVAGIRPEEIPSNLPRSGVKQFVGRDEALKTLHEQLQHKERVAICAIAGMGGVGKTELALQYAQSHQQQGTYPGGLCWLQAAEADVGTQIISFARVQLDLQIPDGLDLPEQVAYCWRRWRGGEVLLVLDDVRSYEKIKPYLPPAEPRFKVLITTRRQRLGESFELLSLEVLSEEAALVLLVSFVGDERISRELAQAKQLCAELGYLPLGLELVGRYLQRKQDLSLAKMRERLKLEHQSLQEPSEEMTARLGVAAAFELSWQELDEVARQLSCLLSLFALAPIPWTLVEQCLPEWDAKDLEDARDDKLLKLSLLERAGQGSYQLHQLIREFLTGKLELERLAEADQLKQRFCQVMVTASQQIPDTPTQQDIITAAPTIPHLAEAVEHQTNGFSDEDLIEPFSGLGRFYEGQGAYSRAEPWYEQCLITARERLGEEHLDVALSLNNLANLYKSQGKYAEAKPLYLQALELRKRLLGEEHPDVALSLNNLANLYRSQGKYAEAEPLYLQALELRKRLLEEEHPDVASSLNNLALLYSSQGRYAEAEPLYLQALELWKRLLGEEHPDVALSLNNLALLYSSQGRYAEAEPLLHQALELWKRLLGEEHPDVPASLNNLAALYYAQGRYAEAEPLYLLALELRKRILGQEHPDVALSLDNLGNLYSSQGRYAEAEPLLQQALELRQRILGQEHPDVATSLDNLGNLYSSQGRYAEAEPLLQQALELRQRILGQEHPRVALSLNNLGNLYSSQGRYAEAELLLQQALELRQRILGQEHPRVALSLNNLGNLYSSQERYTEAEPLLQQALDIAERQLGVNHPHTNTIRKSLQSLRDRATS